LDILLISGLVLFTINYVTGWLLKFRLLSITKILHQIMFALLIINLLIILLFKVSGFYNISLCVLSLLMLFILPFGKKGSGYHITVSTIGFILYVILILNPLNNF